MGGQLSDPEAHGVDIDKRGHVDLIFESQSLGNLYENSEKPPSERLSERFLLEVDGHEHRSAGGEEKRSNDLGIFGLILYNSLRSIVNGDIKLETFDYILF